MTLEQKAILLNDCNSIINHPQVATDDKITASIALIELNKLHCWDCKISQIKCSLRLTQH